MKKIFLILIFTFSFLYSDASFVWFKNTSSYSDNSSCVSHIQDYATAGSYHGSYNSTLFYDSAQCFDNAMYFKSVCDSGFMNSGNAQDGEFLSWSNPNGLYCSPYVCTDVAPEPQIPSYQISVGESGYLAGSCDIDHVSPDKLKFVRSVAMVCNTCVGRGYDLNSPELCQSPNVQTVDIETGWASCGLSPDFEELPEILHENCHGNTLTHNELYWYPSGVCVGSPIPAPIVDPCESVTDNFMTSCVPPNVISGSCESSNNVITSNTLSCNSSSSSSSVPDLCDSFYNSLLSSGCSANDVRGTCEFVNGAITINTLECSPSSSSSSSNGNPCLAKFNEISSNCDTSSNVVSGYSDCIDNGVFVLNDTIKCNPILKRCPVNEMLDSSDDCICKNGYIRNSFGNCWLDNSSLNFTPEQISADLTKQQEQNALLQDLKASTSVAPAPQNNSDLYSRLDTTNSILRENQDILREISEKNNSTDLSSTNKLLKDILEKNGTSSRPGALSDSESQLFNLDFISNEMGGMLSKYSVDLVQTCPPMNDVSFNFRGTQMTILSSSTIDALPISSIRAVVIFMFTIAGLSLVFRGN